MSPQRRSYIDIITDILRVLRLGPAISVQIMHEAHINADQLSMYLSRLKDASIIGEAGPVMELPAFQITDKGLTFLNAIEGLREIIPQEGAMAALDKSKIISLNIGEVLISKGVADLAKQDERFAGFVHNSLQRYRKGEWGEFKEQARQHNTINLTQKRRLFSSYEQEGLPEIWISTTADRSYTTLMFPSEEASMEPMMTLNTAFHDRRL